MRNPINPIDDDAIKLARGLFETDWAVLSSLAPDGYPYASRIAIARTDEADVITLISDLAQHTPALKNNPRCSLLLGDVRPKGDPLTQARMTMVCTAQFIPHGSEHDAALRYKFVQKRPSSKVYAGFSDFHVVLFDIVRVDLNGGFGKAYQFDATAWVAVRDS